MVINGKFNIPPIFYTDDGLILAKSYKNAGESTNNLTEIITTYGLEINKAKISILKYNSKDQPYSSEGIKGKKTIKYLWVEITNKRNYFKKHKISSINKARKLATTHIL